MHYDGLRGGIESRYRRILALLAFSILTHSIPGSSVPLIHTNRMPGGLQAQRGAEPVFEGDYAPELAGVGTACGDVVLVPGQVAITPSLYQG